MVLDRIVFLGLEQLFFRLAANCVLSGRALLRIIRLTSLAWSRLQFLLESFCLILIASYADVFNIRARQASTQQAIIYTN